MTVSKDTKETTGTWLFRGLAIYFLWNIYVDTSKIDVIEQRLDAHEKEINGHERDIETLRGMVFSPAWEKQRRQQSLNEELKDSKFMLEYTDANIAASKELLGRVDSFYKQN